MKKVVFAILFILFPVITQAQESRTDYNFLRLPMSAHAAALGGDNITIIEDDPTLIFHNPALISSVSDKSINFELHDIYGGCQDRKRIVRENGR